MCGIAGIAYHKKHRKINDYERRCLHRALEILYHRGPDAQGVCQGEYWIFGHTRLSVVDPSCSNQPIIDAETGVTLIYNGEVYNFQEIKDKLISRGHKFTTKGDTEVVLKSYLEWGKDCLDRFNGFFAIAIHDKRDRTIFLARDRLGIKPLFYFEDNHSISFASSIPALICLRQIDCRVNLAAVSHYLTTGRTNLGQNTIVDGIRIVERGSWNLISLEDSTKRCSQYWNLPVIPHNQKGNGSFTKAVESCKELLSDSIKLRLNADVPVSLFVSGGLDSAILAHATSKILPNMPQIFCAGSDDKESNEFRYAEMMSSKLDMLLHTEIITSQRFEENWGHLIGLKGLPLSTPNEVSIFELAKSLKKAATVVLTGEGADEIFGGYVQPQFSAFDYDRCVRSEEEVCSDKQVNWEMKSKYGRAWFLNDTDHYLSTGCWLNLYEKSQLLKKDCWNDLAHDEEMISFYLEFFEKLGGCSTFDKRMHLHANFNLENLLSRVDSSTMAASVEARVPFNDHRLVEFAFHLPDHFKMDWRDAESRCKGAQLTVDQIDLLDLLETKKLPRNAFKNDLPQEIIQRKKMSFPIPFNKWFTTSLAERVRSICLDSELSKTLFNSDVIEGMLVRGDPNVWMITNLCLWWQVITDFTKANTVR